MASLFLRLLAITVLSTACAPAALITLTSVDSNRGENVWLRVNGTDEQSFAGVMHITVDSVFARTVVCADYFTEIGYATYNSTLVHPSARPNGQRAAWLVENYLAAATTKTLGAALQLAVWDIIHDSGDGFAAGSIRSAVSQTTAATILSAAQNYLSLSTGRSSSNAVVYLNTSLTNGQPAQALMGAWPSTGPVPTPEPGTMSMLTAGVALVAVARIRRMRAC